MLNDVNFLQNTADFTSVHCRGLVSILGRSVWAV